MDQILIAFGNVEFLKKGFLFCLLILLLFNGFLLVSYLLAKIRQSWNISAETNRLLKSLRLGFLATSGGVMLINGLFLCTGIGFAGAIMIPQPKVISPASPSVSATEITPEEPFKIVFDRPIDTGLLQKQITPQLEGKWEFADTNYPYLSDTLVFIPDKSPVPESRYTIALKDIKGVTGYEKTEYLLSFLTPPLPTVKSVNPANGSQGVLPQQEIIVETDFPHQNQARLDFKFRPDIEAEVKKVNETRYSVRAKGGFKKSTTYTLSVYRVPTSRDFTTEALTDIGESDLISQSTFRTLEAPGVSDYGPKGSGIMTDSSVWIQFKQDMNRENTEKYFSILPAVSGNFSWDSNRKMVFKPAVALNKNTTYTVTVNKAAQLADGKTLDENFNFSFVTIGHVAVVSFYPYANSSGVSLGTTVSVGFNQAVDHSSAQSLFTISPIVNGTFSWSGNAMNFNHSSFAYSTRYTVRIASGVKTVYGLDSVQGFSAAFTTKPQSTMLNVPSYAQGHMYSCMAAAARSALAYKGVYVSENTILGKIGYDSTPFSGTWGNPNAIWGNPYNATVGNIDGRSGGVNWGYGAYWGPTARAISNWRPTVTKTNWNVSGIAQEIANGNPVLVWWVNGVWPAYEVYWKTPTGTQIRGVNSMHVQVVKGFTGSVANPTSFTVTDSGYGYPSHTYDINTFKAKWSWFGNSAVVVR